MSSTGSTPIQIKRSIKFQFAISAFVLLIVALGFNALLSLNSLEKLYVESIASQYSAVGKDLQRNLENALRFGKKIEKFIGMDKILEGTKRNLITLITRETTSVSAFDISVSVALSDGSLLYSTDKKFVGTTLPEQARISYEDSKDDNTSSREVSYIAYKDTYLVPLPIRDTKKKWVATAIIVFDEDLVKNLLNTVRDKNIKTISFILVGSIVFLIILLSLITFDESGTKKFSKLRVYLVIFLVIGSAQIIFSILNTNTFSNYYLQINKQKAETLTTLLKEDIEYLFSKRIQIDKLVKVDVEMGEIIEASPELNSITILDKNEIPLYMATKQGVVDFQKATDEQLYLAYRSMSMLDPEYNVRLALLKEKNVEGYISTNLSKEVIFSRLYAIALDSATVLVISMLFFVELLIMIFQFIERQFADVSQRMSVHYGAIRPAVFLFLFGIDSSITFLPLHMEKLYKPIFGLSKDLVMGLPISVEMFFVGIAIFIAGTWLDQRGWHEPFLSGLFLSSMGVFYSWLAPDAFHFIVSRGIVGLGYGLAWMSSQGFVIAYTDENNKGQGLANLFAGILAGSICGGAAGAILAERLEYKPVFLISAIIIFSVITYSLLFMRNAMRKPESPANKQAMPAVNLKQTLSFLFNRNMISLIFLCAIPGSLAVVGFLNYFSPIYLNRIGESQSNIGRVFMIYGICLIYIAPFLSKYVDASENKKKYIVASGIVGASAFIMFHFFGGIAATAVAILLLGLSASIDASRPYALKLKVSREIGAGKAMGIYNSVSRFGQVIGPMTFGWLIIAMDINKGITYFGVAYLVITILFVLVAQSDKKTADLAR